MPVDEEFEFNFSEDLSEIEFDEGSDKEIIGESKILQIFWHESGHLIGKFISEDLGFDFGEVYLLSYSSEKPIIKSRFYNETFKIKSFGLCKDFYEEENGLCLDIYDSNTQKFVNKEFELQNLNSYLTYIFLGGFFNLYIDSLIHKRKVEPKDFDRIFSHNEDVNYENIEGCAGDDWNRIKLYCSAFKVPMDEIKKYRLELFCIFNGKYNFFEYFTSIIQNTFEKDILKFEDTELKLLIQKFKNEYLKFPELKEMLEEIKNLNKKFVEKNIEQK